MCVDASDIMASDNVTVITVCENTDQLIDLQEFSKKCNYLVLDLQPSDCHKGVKCCF